MSDKIRKVKMYSDLAEALDLLLLARDKCIEVEDDIIFSDDFFKKFAKLHKELSQHCSSSLKEIKLIT